MSENKVEKALTQVELDPTTVKTMEYYAQQENIDVSTYIEKMMTDGYTVATMVGESVVRLQSVNPWVPESLLDPVGEDGTETKKTTDMFQDLRENFPPVSSGIEYPKAFTTATGFNVKIEDPENVHQSKVKEIIEDFDNKVFMDEITRGLDLIVDIMLDEVLTLGVSAAEIVYSGWEDENMDFNQWADKVEPTESNPAKWIPKDLVDSDWKQLKGIKQIKIIPNAYHRLTPYRDPVTWKILYFTIDEDSTDENVEPKKLLPWQVLWLSWNRRGHNLKGVSLIKSVADTAILLRKILNDIGVSINKWSDRKYFFVLGDARSGRTWAPVHVSNFSRDVQKMVKDKGTGIPVPAGFGIESIGGEGGIYDGGTIIDTLLTMICTGMRYPKAFLNEENQGPDDKAWLGWLVTYSRDQKQLRRAIEDQVWRRHLYCKEGVFRRIKKQGVSVDKQEFESIYIPEMEWSSEGKWHQETKLKMLKSILDAANPIIPELKFELEKDMARTLGYPETELSLAKTNLDIDRDVSLADSKIQLERKTMEFELLELAKKQKMHLELIPIFRFGKAPEPEFEEGEEPSDGDQKPDSEVKGKTQGKRKAPDPVKRLEGGVHKTRIDKNPTRGKSKPLGGTRKPRNIKSVGEAEEVESEGSIPVDINVNIKVENESIKSDPVEIKVTHEPLDINIDSTPQQLDVKIETEPQRVSVDTTNFNQSSPIVIKVDEEAMSRQRELLLLDHENLKMQVMNILDERTKGISEAVERNEVVLNEMKKLENQIKYRENKTELSEKDKLAIEVRKKKIELMEKMMKEE